MSSELSGLLLDESVGQGNRLSGELSGLLLDESVGWQLPAQLGSALVDSTELALQIGGSTCPSLTLVRLGLRSGLSGGY